MRAVLTILVVACIIFADLRFNSLSGTRSVLNNLATPLYWVADIPSRIGQWSEDNIQSHSFLRERTQKLDRENLVLKGRSQQMAALRAENARLRALLNSAALLQNDVLVAELIGVSPDPVRHQMILNKGASDGVYVGQALIDEAGLLGQVEEVSEFSSRVLLITDATHSIPVQVNRNGVRAIAEGVGNLGSLEIHHVAATTDIVEGDLLVSSGLGDRFPVGYPVAIVSRVSRDPGKTFATIEASPVAALDRSRYVLLVFAVQSDRASD